MELVNRTAVPAEAIVTAGVPEDGPRIGMLLAKATFTVADDGRVALDTQDPHPLYDSDEETELGLLPADSVPRRDPAFEVILLGAAHAPGGAPVPSMGVRLTVGDVTRSIAVFGDRRWTENGGISPPRPFTSMPLVWERAFGGSCEVYLDDSTTVEVQDPINPLGRGFDADSVALRTAAALGAPRGYPRLRYDRLLPNLEDPAAPVRSPADAPDPVGWATVPMDIGLSQLRLIREVQAYGEVRDPRRAEIEMYHRAHPTWVMGLPPAGAPVTLDGLRPGGPVTFSLPELRISADYVLGDRQGNRELAPQMLVLLPEEGRFYLVYRSAFTVEVASGLERSFRLRLDEGWYRYPAPHAHQDGG